MQKRGLLLSGLFIVWAASAGSAADPPDAADPLFDSGSAEATPGIEERIVLADESDAARDFAASDSVKGFDASDLEALGAQNIADLAKFTPNLEIVTAGATTATFFIRGVGLNDFNANASGAVSIYQDDVALNSPALQLGTLFDMEAVNVMRGPQGTGAFRNASAGAIKLYSRKPSGGYGGYLNAQYGRFDYIDLEGAVEAPIYKDIISSRFAFRYRDRKGFAKNGCGEAPAPELRQIRGTAQPFGPSRNEATWRDGVAGTGIHPDDPRLYHPVLDDAGEPTGALTTADRRNGRDPSLSVCGEFVQRILQTKNDNTAEGGVRTVNGISEIATGLPRDVNAQHNWAARGIFRVLPSLDMDWLVNVHGSRRNEHSRLGQSTGTGGHFCDPDQDIADCLPINFPNEIPPGRINGLLGAADSGRYIEPDVAEMQAQFLAEELASCGPACVAVPPSAPREERDAQREAFAGANNNADIRTAESVASDLDKRPYRGDYDRVGRTKNDTWGVSLKGEVALPGDIDFQTVSAYDSYDRLVSIDLDFSPTVLFEIETADQGWQFFQQVDFSLQPFDDIPFRVSFGGFYLQETLDVQVANDFGTGSTFGVSEREYTQKIWSAAGYLTAEWDFWEDFTLDGGFRYNYDRKEIDYALVQAELDRGDHQLRDWEAPTGTVRLTYRFREDTHAYWKYTRGWKGGHYNATSSLNDGVTIATPETIDSFETGILGSWFQSRASLQLGFFYYNYKDYQIFTTVDSFSGTPEFVILNVPKARMYGAEVDFKLRPLPGTFLNVNFGWLESQFIDFVQIQLQKQQVQGNSLVIARELQNSGNRLLNSPQFKVGLTAEQVIPLGRYGSLTARYDGAWTDDSYFDATEGAGIPNNQNIEFLPEDTIGQRAFWLHNVRLGYRDPSGTIELAGWCRNLTNQTYKTFAFDGSTFRQTTIYFTGDPRTYGVSLGIRF